VPTEDLLTRFQHAVRKPLPWTEVKDAAAQEVVHREVDLLKLLPIPKHNEHDSGPYITAALLIARNPKTGNPETYQSTAVRSAVPIEIGVLLLPRHTHHYFRMAEAAGEALEIALVIGVHPACILASQAIAALDEDEMEIAGALMGAPGGNGEMHDQSGSGAGPRRDRDRGKDPAEGSRAGGPVRRNFRNITARARIARSFRSMP